MTKVQCTPNTTLFPVPVALISCGAGDEVNLFTVNRIASCNAEPPMISISVRPSRASHDLIEQWGEFVLNIPAADMEMVTDFVGATTMQKTDKWGATGLTQRPATAVQAPLLMECPVNLECRLVHTMRLPSHSMFVAEVVAMHADEDVLNARQEVTFDLTTVGMVYRSTVVRERPVDKFKPANLLEEVYAWRDER